MCLQESRDKKTQVCQQGVFLVASSQATSAGSYGCRVYINSSMSMGRSPNGSSIKPAIHNVSIMYADPRRLLVLLAVNFNFLVFSMVVDDVLGQVFSLFILTVAAAESAIGLALLVIYYRARGTVAIEFINLMKG